MTNSVRAGRRLWHACVAVSLLLGLSVLAGCNAAADYSALEFRPVLAADSASSAQSQGGDVTRVSADQGAEFAALDCTQIVAHEPRAQVEPSAELVACGLDGAERFALGPAALQGSAVSDVAVAPATTQAGATTGHHVIRVELTADGASALADVTSRISAFDDPRDRLALVAGGYVVSAPTVMGAITEGNLEISGSFSESEAREIAAMFSAPTD